MLWAKMTRTLSSSAWIPWINPQSFAKIFCEIVHFKVWKVKKKHEKLASFPYRVMKTFRIYSWYSLANFECYQKGFICIPSSNFPKIKVWGPFCSFLLNGCYGNHDRYENFNFNFWWIFPSCLRVQSLIMITWKKKMFSAVEILKFVVSDHHNAQSY